MKIYKDNKIIKDTDKKFITLYMTDKNGGIIKKYLGWD